MLQLNMVIQLSSITLCQNGTLTLMSLIMMDEALYTGTLNPNLNLKLALLEEFKYCVYFCCLFAFLFFFNFSIIYFCIFAYATLHHSLLMFVLQVD